MVLFTLTLKSKTEFDRYIAGISPLYIYEHIKVKRLTVKLYHYSTEKFHTLLTRRSVGGLTTEQIKQAEDKAVLLEDVGAYIDHISLFIEPVPSNSIAKIFNDQHPFWKSGKVIYEHVIDTKDLDKDISFILVETPIIGKFTDQFDWTNPTKEDRVNYIKAMHREMRRLKLIDNGVNNLIEQVKPYLNGTLSAFIKARHSAWAEDTKEQYAAEVPHLMVYPKDGKIKVSSVKKITLGSEQPKTNLELFHISFNSKLPKVLKPRQPDGSTDAIVDPMTLADLEKNSFAEHLPPRVSFSPSIQECFTAVYPNVSHYFEKENYPHMDYYVYRPTKLVKRIDPDLVLKEVWDAHVTNEVCFIEDVPCELIAQIRIFNPYKGNKKVEEIRTRPFQNAFMKEQFVAPVIQYRLLKLMKSNVTLV